MCDDLRNIHDEETDHAIDRCDVRVHLREESEKMRDRKRMKIRDRNGGEKIEKISAREQTEED